MKLAYALFFLGACSAPPPPSCPAPAPHPTQLAPELAAYSFLLGTWEAQGGGTTFEAGAQGHAIVRTNWSESPKGRHDDTMMIFPTPQGVRAAYADNEGHAIDYAVTAEAKSATLLSAEGHGPRFRLTYTQKDDGSVAGAFEMQPPGATDFKPYLAWTMRKR